MGNVERCDKTLPTNVMMDLGVHQYYVPQILRLFFGAAHNSNASAALECYKRAFPVETAQAMDLQAKLEGRRG
jgi:hypothetical protein